ncbi:MAG: hypothetical protein ACP5R5_08105 [Armatimonadota bacterium]
MDISTVFIIAVTTSRMIFPGLPAISPASGESQDAAVAAVRSLTMDLFSGEKANPLSKAEVTVPDGLRVAGPIQLLIDLKKKPEPANGSESKTRYVVKTYWGCADEIPQGQPRVCTSDELPPAQPLEKLPGASHAYWSSDMDKPLGSDAAARGTYRLATNYCGATSIVLDAEQDFLDPIDLESTPREPDLRKPIKITWKPIPRALAYLVTAVGGNAAESVNWTSSADPDASDGLEDRPLTRTEIARLIENKTLLPADAHSCTIPARVFLGSKSVFVTVTAFGPDKVQTADGIETRVIVRSTAGVPVFGTSYKQSR